MKVLFATPYLSKPTELYRESLENSLPAVEAAGWEHSFVAEVDCPYISKARASIIEKFLSSDADTLMFIDYDMGWEPEDLVKILGTDGDVVGGTYRFRAEPEDYMSLLDLNDDKSPKVKYNGCIKAKALPAGFLKITRSAIIAMIHHYPWLKFGDTGYDLFQHGVCFGDNIWYGEDYAFSKRWTDIGGELWIVPDLNLNHNGYHGNFHEYLLRTTM